MLKDTEQRAYLIRQISLKLKKTTLILSLPLFIISLITQSSIAKAKTISG